MASTCGRETRPVGPRSAPARSVSSSSSRVCCPIFTAADNVALPSAARRHDDQRRSLRTGALVARRCRARRPLRCVPGDALRRRATARRHRPRPDQRATPASGRRADQRPRRGAARPRSPPCSIACAASRASACWWCRTISTWRAAPTARTEMSRRPAARRLGRGGTCARAGAAAAAGAHPWTPAGRRARDGRRLLAHRAAPGVRRRGRLRRPGAAGRFAGRALPAPAGGAARREAGGAGDARALRPARRRQGRSPRAATAATSSRSSCGTSRATSRSTSCRRRCAPTCRSAANRSSCPSRPIEESAAQVLKITGRQSYRYVFEAKPTEYAQLLPRYMHVRFVNAMLVSPNSTAERRAVRAPATAITSISSRRGHRATTPSARKS